MQATTILVPNHFATICTCRFRYTSALVTTSCTMHVLKSQSHLISIYPESMIFCCGVLWFSWMFRMHAVSSPSTSCMTVVHGAAGIWGQCLHSSCQPDRTGTKRISKSVLLLRFHYCDSICKRSATTSIGIFFFSEFDQDFIHFLPLGQHNSPHGVTIQTTRPN